jgi:urease accessory protein
MRFLLITCLVLTAHSRAAQAHLVTTGLGPVYDGVAHFVLSPEDVVPVLGLAVLCGLHGPRHGRLALFALAMSWFAGSVAGAIFGASVGDTVAALSFMVIGSLVASNVALPVWATTAAAAVLGAGHGYADGSGLVPDRAGVGAIIGMTAAAFVLCALAVALVLPLRSRLAHVALRVAGSWMAAAGVLLLGWSLHRVIRAPT